MVTHTDYPFNNEYQLVYPNQLEDGRRVFDLGIVGKFNYWDLQVSTRALGEQNFICAALDVYARQGAVCRIYYYLSFVNHQDESKSKVFTDRLDWNFEEPLSELRIPESKVLDEKNGWLKDGKLTVALGIHVEAIKSDIWTFNFYEPIFQYEKTKNSIEFVKKEDHTNRRSCHKQLVVHHSPTAKHFRNEDNVLVELEDYFGLDSFENFLQMLHGAHIKIDLIEYIIVVCIAQRYKLYNVIRYCEMELIQRKDEFGDDIEFFKNHIQLATKYKLSRYLASVLRDMESPKAIKEDFRHVDIERMTGEMMKQCVMNLLEI